MQNIESKEINGLKYIIEYPKNFDCKKKYPTILLLHGAGSRGKDISILTNNVFFKTKEFAELRNTFGFVTFAPQCPSEQTWFDHMNRLKELVELIQNTSFVENKKIYLIGPSMGGYGTWQLAMSIPEYFAAIVPICGGGMYWNAGRLKNVPVWAFHGDSDTVVLPRESEIMVKATNNRGGNAKLTLCQNVKHDSWLTAYGSKELYEWLLSFENNNIHKIESDFTDSKIYG